MKIQTIVMMAVLALVKPVFAEEPFGHAEWKDKPKESFSGSEENFNLVMKKLLDGYVDQGVTKDELYRAATAGMLEALNDGKEHWNKLISPTEFEEMKVELAGKVSGIGVTLKWDESQGYGRVLHVITGSPSEKAGIKADDEILSVEGKKFKGKPFRDLVYALRGKPGESVHLKILREDKILSLSVNRDVLTWNAVELTDVTPSTALLTISFFSEDTPARMKEKLAEVNSRKVKNLIVDLRDNTGGGFEQAIEVAGMFAPEGAVVVTTKDRAGHEEQHRGKGSLLDPSVHVTLLVNHGTTCGGELLAEALKETRKAQLIGQTTFGKWNAQTVEMLPNHFGVKYTVEGFYAPSGKTFQGIGIKPDLEIPLASDIDVGELRAQADLHKRLEQDAQLRAAIELRS